jgi:hypothetical protein
MFSGFITVATSRRRGRLGSLIFAFVLLITATPAVLAAPSSKLFHQPYDVTFQESDCGFVLSAHLYGVLNIWNTVDAAGQPLRKVTLSGKAVYTNVANGKTLTWHAAGRIADTSVVSGGPDRLVRTRATTGLTEQFKASDGTILSKDVGRLVIVTTIDDNGTPLDPIDDTLVSVMTTFEAGPHPDANSGNLTYYCAIYASALT